MEYYKKPGLLPNQGFIKPKIEKEHFKRGDGKLGKGEILMPGGHGWGDYLPKLERQNEFFETMHCTVFNTLNPIEALAKRKFGEDWNKSERYNGVLAGISTQGGSPHEVAESIRKFGVIEQSSLPWTPDLNTFWKFSSPRPMTADKIEEGKQWLRQYVFGHEWVVTYGKSKLATSIYRLGEFFNFVSTPEALKDALQYSPLGVGVLAWPSFDSQGRAIKSRWQSDNHWTVLYDYVEGDHWKVYDSYYNCHVKLQWNYPIAFAKVYTLDKADFVDRDAQYIKDNMLGMNVKGTEKAGIYFIYAGKKYPYPSMEEYNRICDRWFPSRSYKVVAQDALDLIPEGYLLSYDKIASIIPFVNIKNSLTK